MSKVLTNQIEPKSGDNITTDKYIQQKGLPYFRAGRDAGNLNSAADIVFNSVFEDNNGDYDNTTGKFTAPVDGTYFFSWTILSSSTAGQEDNVAIYKNSTSSNQMYLRSHGDRAAYNTMSGSLVIKLVAGDTIYARLTSGGIYGSSKVWTQVCGYQIA